MGNCLPSGYNMKTTPGFDDDFYFRLPLMCDSVEKRSEFDENMNEHLRSRGEDFNEFKSKTRSVERAFFVCFLELCKRSFDYKEMCDALKESRNDSLNIMGVFSTVMRKNFDFYGNPDLLEINETINNNEHCYMMKFNTNEDKKAELEFEKELKREIDGDEKQEEDFDVISRAKLESLDKEIEEMKKITEEQQIENNEYFKKEMKASSERINKEKEKFRENEQEKQKVCDEEIKKIREKREEYEKESERMRQESLEKFHTMISEFLEYLKLKQHWQMEEDKWENWLKFLRSEVSAMKMQFIKFESLYIQLDQIGITDEELVKEELDILHNRTISSFNTLRNAYYKVKNLSEQNPDRGFLLILQSQISKVCRTVLSVLYGIDNAKIDENLLEILRGLFSLFDSSDIFYTSKLRELEKSENMEKFKSAKDPEEYTPKSSVTMEEVKEKLINPSNLEKKKETLGSYQNEESDEQKRGDCEEETRNYENPEQESSGSPGQLSKSEENSSIKNLDYQQNINEEHSKTEEP